VIVALVSWSHHVAWSSSAIALCHRHPSSCHVVLGSPVQSGLLSKIDKTETGTGPPRLKNHEKLD
jgi:hypothetical protein